MSEPVSVAVGNHTALTATGSMQSLGPKKPVANSSSSRFYRPELDTLRFFAFFGVFMFHVIPHDPAFYSQHRLFPSRLVNPICAVSGAGAFGVDLFFALSAYLITVLLLRERQLRGSIDVKAFYIRRILRIWPLYFFFIAIAAIVSAWNPMQHMEWQYAAGYLLLAGNWVYTWRGLPDSLITIPLWSISVEEQFYLAWPLIARRVSVTQMKYVVVALLMLGYISRFVLVAFHVTGTAVEYDTFARIDPIALGIGLAILFGDRPLKLSLLARLSLVLVSLGIWFTASFYGGLNAPRAMAPVLGTLIGRPAVAFGAIVLLIAFIGAPDAGAKVLAHPILTYLGRISYGLYVYHVAALTLAKHLFATDNIGSHVARALLGLVLTILFSMASYRWLETPFLHLKDRFAKVLSRPV